MDASKAALLQAIAAKGAIGSQASQQQAQAQQAAYKDALATNAGLTSSVGLGAPSGLLNKINADQTNFQNTYSMDTALAAGNFNNAINATSAANASYMDQARAAIPALREQTQAGLNQIAWEREMMRQEAEFERQRREAELEQMRQDAIDREAERMFQREEMDFAREERAHEKSMWERELERNGGLTPEQAEEFDTAIQERRAEIAGEVAQRGDGPAAAFDEITTTQPTFQGALVMARRLINEAVVNRDIPPTDRDDEFRGLVRHLFAFYNPLNPTPSEDRLPEVLSEVGIDPETVFGRVGYTGSSRSVGPRYGSADAADRIRTGTRRADEDLVARFFGGDERPRSRGRRSSLWDKWNSNPLSPWNW